MLRDASSGLLLLLLSVCGPCGGCLPEPPSAYTSTGIVCRLTYPAAVVLNEKTTKVIEAAFQHARYPSVKGEKSILFIGKVIYGLDNLEIHNLSIGRSMFELRPGEGIAIEIQNVSAVFKGTIQYGYGSWIVNLAHSIDFEIESQIDLGVNPKLYCGASKVAADTSDCYLNFHRLHLHLQGDRQPNWLKKLFTDFITFTVKLVIKGQICKEINKVADILADFIQDTAKEYLRIGDISVDIGITTVPVITANYIESYHKGLTSHNGTVSVINDSVFHPSHLTEDRMLYFWVSDQVFNPMLAAAHHDGLFVITISRTELTELFKRNMSSATPDFIRKCLESVSPTLRVWSSSVPFLNTSTLGTRVWAEATGELDCGNRDTLFFKTNVAVDITASYADKKLFLHHNTSQVVVSHAELPSQRLPLSDGQLEFIREAVKTIGLPKALAVLEVELTKVLDKQGTYLFDIFNPVVLPRDGFVIMQMDFGFPHHLLVEFLKKTLQ